MICPNCGQSYNHPVKFCEECGARMPAEAGTQPEISSPAADPAGPSNAVRPANSSPLAPGPAYIRPDYDPARDGRRSQPSYAAQVPPPVDVNAHAAAPGMPQPVPEAQPPADYPSGGPPFYSVLPEQKPSSTGMIIFSVINMLCCGLGISFILGIIALIFAIIASGDKTAEEARRNLKTARTLNFVGLGFVVLGIIVAVVILVASLLFGDYGPYWGHF